MLQGEAMVAGEYCLWVCIRLRHAILGLGIRGSMHATHRCHGRCHDNQPGAYGKLGEILEIPLSSERAASHPTVYRTALYAKKHSLYFGCSVYSS